MSARVLVGVALLAVGAWGLVSRMQRNGPGLIDRSVGAVKETAKNAIDAIAANPIGRDTDSGASRVLDALEGPLALDYDPNGPARRVPGQTRRGIVLEEIDLSKLPKRRFVPGAPTMVTRALDFIEKPLRLAYDPNPRGSRLNPADLSKIPARRAMPGAGPHLSAPVPVSATTRLLDYFERPLGIAYRP
jgi:hypothetical protein